MGSAGRVITGVSTGLFSGGLSGLEKGGQDIGGFLGVNPQTKLADIVTGKQIGRAHV